MVGAVRLEVVDACGEPLSPQRGVDQAGSEGVPRLRLELWVAATHLYGSPTVLYIRATRHAVGRTVRPLVGLRIIPAWIEAKLLEGHGGLVELSEARGAKDLAVAGTQRQFLCRLPAQTRLPRSVTFK